MNLLKKGSADKLHYTVEFVADGHTVPEHYTTKTLKGAEHILDELIESANAEEIHWWRGTITPTVFDIEWEE